MGRKRNKVGSKKRLVISIFVFLIAAAACVVIGFNAYLNASLAPANAADTSYVNVTIPSGSSTVRIGQILESYGLLRNPSMFRIITRLGDYDGTLRAGEYQLSPSMSTSEILEILSLGLGIQDTRRFTIPEGYTLARMADRLASQGIVDRDRFLELTEHGDFPFDFIDELPAGPHRLEGFLFPDTYEVFMTATEEEIIHRMLSQFDRVFTEEYRNRAAELGWSMHEIVTIASLIEAETRAPFERPMVASVIYNRLDIRMPLQLDATVQFALGERRERLLFRDIEAVRDHPYNTYHIPGLPPGPICAPGAASIHAALFPADTDYLFYVLKPGAHGGAHNFSRTLAEHNRFAREYHNWLNQQQ